MLLIEDPSSSCPRPPARCARTSTARSGSRAPRGRLALRDLPAHGPIHRMAKLVAGHGFLVVVPEIFHDLETPGPVLAYDKAGTARGNGQDRQAGRRVRCRCARRARLARGVAALLRPARRDRHLPRRPPRVSRRAPSRRARDRVLLRDRAPLRHARQRRRRLAGARRRHPRRAHDGVGPAGSSRPVPAARNLAASPRPAARSRGRVQRAARVPARRGPALRSGARATSYAQVVELFRRACA